ncbi:sulfotransferase family 2 domain-containing protein [Methylocystis rosea]|uniref:Sulfotransferase family protein n=1 Tax=Methylocystis rosea TaxID=173366 RepID=A0A3G8M9B4_9HYPH|nr:sulfotransferase family 2 domain-containing protein [Methylocystis rosea]AZG78084.1 hypothetical protein EHO51_15830 [Methylocystis rosea]
MVPVFFIHIPKTAGTSVNDLLSSLYAPAETAQHIELHCEWHKSDFWTRFPFVSGHVAYEVVRQFVPAHFKIVTFLRDPLQHLMSVIRYQYAITAPEGEDLFGYVSPELRSISERMHEVDFTNPGEFERWLTNVLAEGQHGLNLFDNMQTRAFCRLLIAIAASQRQTFMMQSRI